jgi:tRNA-5-taurinomethyluridine 2-sulfurtransferase
MKIAVLTSGGVDSSVALRLLKDQGHDLTAFYLKIWLQDEFSFLGDCPWEEDLKFVREVCNQNNIPLEVLSLQNEYWDSVVTYTIDEIKAGRTPNPDIYCNSLIKFGQFYDKISPDFEKVASGHYARVEEKENLFYLKRSPDPVKDQTYFLAYLKQSQLARALFPIGVFTKPEVRSFAEKYDLANKGRRDSQGICFLGQIKFNDFVKHHLGEMRGDIVDISNNKKMGEHPGYYYYTIGQRSGLGLGGGPWFVVKKDLENNIIYISLENPAVRERKHFKIGNFNWITEKPSARELKVKIRHGANMYGCTLDFMDENCAEVKLDKGDRGVAPGQFAVFYNEDYCLGGGVILE